jgi:hypothetical protein
MPEDRYLTDRTASIAIFHFQKSKKDPSLLVERGAKLAFSPSPRQEVSEKT